MAGRLKIDWQPAASLSAIHAAYTVASGNRCTDTRLEEALLTPVTQLNQRLVSGSIDVAKFWRRLVTETFTDRVDADQRRICEIALYSAGAAEMQLDQIATAITHRLVECRSIFTRRFPKLTPQLSLRSQPLQQSWNALGPGLLASITRQIWQDSPPKDWLPSKVTGLLVQPVRGGDGDYDSHGEQFWIEAVLTDTNSAVPEILRIAWLLTQVAIDAHTRERSGDGAHSLPWRLASVPIVLAAAADLELAPVDALPIATAIDLWNLGTPATADVVDCWWTQARESSNAVPVALKALDRMLNPDTTANPA